MYYESNQNFADLSLNPFFGVLIVTRILLAQIRDIPGQVEPQDYLAAAGQCAPDANGDSRSPGQNVRERICVCTLPGQIHR